MALGVDGFASACDTYERGRPSYPEAFIRELYTSWGLTSGRVVADVAAGTGKLTRQVRATGARCLAVEPSPAMRAECRRAAPSIPVVAGSAEALPLADRSVDLVTVAQAFHWFEPRISLHEMGRVLRPGGVAVLVWNEREISLPWAAALNAVMTSVAPPPHPPTAEMRRDFDGDPHFGPFTHWSTRHEVAMPAAAVEDMVASRSYVRVLNPDERHAVLRQVRAVIDPLPEPILMPYVTNAYCARVADSRCACTDEEGHHRWSD